MARFVKRRAGKLGAPPGTLVHIGGTRPGPAKITFLDYDESSLDEGTVSVPADCAALRDKPTVTWIKVDGLHDIEAVEAIGKQFGLHPLVLEDIVNTAQRPKADDYGQTLFVVVKMLTWDESKQSVSSEQVSFILGQWFLLSFQERPGDVFDMIRDRVRSGKGRIRKMGADYLLYALLDAIVDHYFVLLEKLGDCIEQLEEMELSDPKPEALRTIRGYRNELVIIRKACWPLRELIGGIERDKNSLIADETGLYFRDLYDHSIQVMETAETYRDVLSGALEIYLTSVSNKMNEVMKVLTIIATIFIPLTFIAGIYGMNFSPDSSPLNMPELKWYWGYPAALGAMALTVVGMVIFFRRKKWL